MKIKIKLIAYKVLTAWIILLGKLRDKAEWGIDGDGRTLRFDRTLPWVKGQPRHGLWWSCCDCGLSHYFDCGSSGTPARPKDYNYSLRFGAKGHTDPDPQLGERAYGRWIQFLAEIWEAH